MIKKLFIILCAIFGLATAQGVLASGFGISPIAIDVDILNAGSHYEKTFILSRGTPDEDRQIIAVIEGEEITPWITVDKGMSFIAPEGEQRIPVKIIVDVPSNATLGDYEGSIRFISSPVIQEGGGNIAEVAVTLTIDLTVTDEIVEAYRVTGFKIPEFEEGSASLAYMRVSNDGNITTRPDSVHIDLTYTYNEDIIESHDIVAIEAVDPFTTKDVTLRLTTELGVGTYWANVTAFNGKEEVFKNKIAFVILPLDSLYVGQLSKFVADKTKVDVDEQVTMAASFNNIGKQDVDAIFGIRVYNKKGLLVNSTTTESQTVSPAESGEFELTFIPEKAGKYTVHGYVEYSGKETPSRELMLSVSNPLMTQIIIIASSIIGLIVLGWPTNTF